MKVFSNEEGLERKSAHRDEESAQRVRNALREMELNGTLGSWYNKWKLYSATIIKKSRLMNKLPGSHALLDAQSDELVLQAVQEAINGHRRWNESAYDEFYKFILGAISSIWNNQCNKLYENEKKYTDFKNIEYLPNHNLSPEQTYIAKETFKEHEQHLSEFLNYLRDYSKDPLPYQIVEAFWNDGIDLSKSKELAEYLNTSEKEINNAKKRLKRRWKHWQHLLKGKFPKYDRQEKIR